MDLVGKLVMTDQVNQYLCNGRLLHSMVTGLCHQIQICSRGHTVHSEICISIWGATENTHWPRKRIYQPSMYFYRYFNKHLTFQITMFYLFNVTVGLILSLHHSYRSTPKCAKFLCAPYHPQTNGLVERLNGTIQKLRDIFYLLPIVLCHTDVCNILTSAWVVPTDVVNALTGVAAASFLMLCHHRVNVLKSVF